MNECASVYYLLALAYEAGGQTDRAVEAYWYIWKNFPDSLYAIASQYKLGEK